MPEIRIVETRFITEGVLTAFVSPLGRGAAPGVVQFVLHTAFERLQMVFECLFGAFGGQVYVGVESLQFAVGERHLTLGQRGASFLFH